MDFQINMRIKLQGEDSNSGPSAKPSSDTMLNDQLSQKLKLVGFGFNMNIMLQQVVLCRIRCRGKYSRRGLKLDDCVLCTFPFLILLL